MAVFRGFTAEGIVACFEEAPGGGDMFDIDAPRNAPAKSPELHLDKLIWHSALSQYEVALGPVDVTVNHTALAGKTAYRGVSFGAGPLDTGGGISVTLIGDLRTSDISIGAHGAGGVPKVMLAYGGRILPAGYVVQQGAGQSRTISPWADASNVYIREFAVSSDVALGAVSFTYQLLVLRKRSANPALPLFSGGSAGLQMGRGIIDSSREYLRAVGFGDSPFSLDNGFGIDAENGRLRTAAGGVVVTESGYSGSMPAPPFVQVGV